MIGIARKLFQNPSGGGISRVSMPVCLTGVSTLLLALVFITPASHAYAGRAAAHVFATRNYNCLGTFLFAYRQRGSSAPKPVCREFYQRKPSSKPPAKPPVPHKPVPAKPTRPAQQRPPVTHNNPRPLPAKPTSQPASKPQRPSAPVVPPVPSAAPTTSPTTVTAPSEPAPTTDTTKQLSTSSGRARLPWWVMLVTGLSGLFLGSGLVALPFLL